MGDAPHVPTHRGADLSAALANPQKASPSRAVHPNRILRFIIFPSIERVAFAKRESPLHDRGLVGTCRPCIRAFGGTARPAKRAFGGTGRLGKRAFGACSGEWARYWTPAEKWLQGLSALGVRLSCPPQHLQPDGSMDRLGEVAYIYGILRWRASFWRCFETKRLRSDYPRPFLFPAWLVSRHQARTIRLAQPRCPFYLVGLRDACYCLARMLPLPSARFGGCSADGLPPLLRIALCPL